MGSYYSSLEQIKEEFQIAEEKPEKLRAELRARQSLIHPDRSGGSFASEEDEKLFHRLSQAIDFIDKREESGDLVPISAVTDLTKAVIELVRAQSPAFDNTLS